MRTVIPCSFCGGVEENKEDLFSADRSSRMCLDCRTKAALQVAREAGHSPIRQTPQDSCVITPDFKCSRCDAALSTGQKEGTFFGGSILLSGCHVKEKKA